MLVHPSSLRLLNGRSVTTVIPAGSTPPGGGGVAAVTEIAAVPVFVSLNAEIVALPAAMPMTSPDDETELTAGLLELQVIRRPVSGLLFASSVAADSCTVAPT